MTRRPDPPTRAEVLALISRCNRSPVGRRNRMHLVLLYRTGLRAAESCSLELADVRLAEATVRVLRPKGVERGAEARDVGLDDRTREALAAWIAQSRGIAPGPLFMSRSGAAVHPSYLRQLMPRLARSAGISRRIHPHALRHAFACELYREGVRIREIQYLLGHTKLETTATYLRSLGCDEAVDVARRRAW